MGSHSVSCHPAEVTFPPLPQPIKPGIWFSDPRGMRCWVNVIGLLTYWGGISAHRWYTHFGTNRTHVEQFCSRDERCYHNAKPSTLLSLILSNIITCNWNTKRLACDVSMSVKYWPAADVWWCAAGDWAVLDWEPQRTSERTVGKDRSHWQHAFMDQGMRVTVLLQLLYHWWPYAQVSSVAVHTVNFVVNLFL